MRNSCLVPITIFCAVPALAQAGARAPSQATDTGWYWFATCGGPSMTLELEFDTVTVYRASFPICRASTRSAATQGQGARIEFRFQSGRPIAWSGYRDAVDTTRNGEVIEANVWLAGADPEAMILGLTFMRSHRILMNTVHIAHPPTIDSTVVAPGIVVRTSPGSATR